MPAQLGFKLPCIRRYKSQHCVGENCLILPHSDVDGLYVRSLCFGERKELVVSSRDGVFGSHGNQVSGPRVPLSERFPDMSVHKVPADSVPYGDSISRNGRTVWAAYGGDRLVCVAASADEARRKCIDIFRAEEAKRHADRARAEGEG